MFHFKVILFALASLSTVRADDECGVPKHYFSIDKEGSTNCGSDCAATVVFSGIREGNAEFVTIDMIADQYEPTDYMRLQFLYDGELRNLTCFPNSVYRIKSAPGLQCNWKLELTSHVKFPVTNSTLLSDLLVNETIVNTIYFSFNGRNATVASSLTHLIPYKESFPDCTEYDVITFYDPQLLNKITLSKKKDSITGFIYSLKKSDEHVNRSITFTNTDATKYLVICNDDFNTIGAGFNRWGLDDFSSRVTFDHFSHLPLPGKCGFNVPLKFSSYVYKYEFDFNKKPLNMEFKTTQANAGFYQSNIKFKFD